MGEILFEHAAPWWAIAAALLFAAAAAVATAWLYLGTSGRSGLLVFVRLLFLLVLGWCLLQPVRKETRVEPVLPRFVVAVDQSASMALAPRGASTNRWGEALQVLASGWETALPAECRVDYYLFDAEPGARVPLSEVLRAEPVGTATGLRTTLRRLSERYRGQNLVGLLLLSDGNDTRESGSEWASASWPCPIFTVRLEPADGWEVEPDLRVESVNTPRRVVVGWDTRLNAVVSGQGTGGQLIQVQLFKDGRLLDERPTQVPPEGGSREVSFPLEHPAVGQFEYLVRALPLTGETRTNDNAIVVSVQVVDARNRLLYLEDVPRWESKYLTRALKANPNISALSFIRGPGGRFMVIGEREEMTLELTAEQLARFKIIIVGDLDAETMTESRAEELRRFVENGGSLILLGGSRAWGEGGFAATPLRSLLPVTRDWTRPAEESRFSLALTEEGRSHAAFASARDAWDRIPPVLSVFPGGRPAGGASVLLTARSAAGVDEPLVTVQRYGQGRVVSVLTDSLWRWQMDAGTEKAYPLFWNQMLEWLLPAEQETVGHAMDLFADTDQLFLGERIRLSARSTGRDPLPDGAAVICEIETPGGRRIPLTMIARDVVTESGAAFAGYGAEYVPQEPGLHQAVARVAAEATTVESAPYAFFVKAYTPESNPRPANVEILRILSRSSGGRFCEAGELRAALVGLKAETREEERSVFATRWNLWAVFVTLVGLASLEWLARRKQNLP